MESFELIDNFFQIVVLLPPLPQAFLLCGAGAVIF